ncbi:small heat shock protein, chloroplastic-like isoform X2 [Hibiscus syriacus]|uniref:small heat shock protein, chloroplastic-like isoform X2 n=1 Tax=Hibiscus syriacus TaxID=106335 RepID=UPI00192323DD|nr:small heat shock protein, chloroplastic-like isoform X2 [Hibiscus syriacus]
MSGAISNITISFPLHSSNPRRNPCHFPFTNNRIFKCKNCIGAMAAQNRGNLDHLQRATTRPDKKRVDPLAPTGSWDRFPTERTMQQMMETMERIMEDPFAYSTPLPSSPEDSRGRRTPWEIKEREGEYKVRFDVPGMNKDDVKVWVEENTLVFKAEKVDEDEDEEWDAKSFGRYGSRVILPENVEFEKIKAQVKDGVLYITVPKASRDGRILNINVN